MDSIGQPDPNMMADCQNVVIARYPWSISGNWWR